MLKQLGYFVGGGGGRKGERNSSGPEDYIDVLGRRNKEYASRKHVKEPKVNESVRIY